MLYPKIRRYVGVQKLLCHEVKHHAGIQLLLYLQIDITQVAIYCFILQAGISHIATV